ncbi:hypothetical protein V1514DRAFT_318816 [Lipomyces japonicus]|uniref:uncharacterized protein n=1 Tax=Lipomyces japonicus TaxID=56871 RepID=UPI0034CF48D2
MVKATNSNANLLSSPSKIRKKVIEKPNSSVLLTPKRTWKYGDKNKIRQCIAHIDTCFEEELYENGVLFLESVLSSSFPEAYIPSTDQLELLFTMISHPRFTSTVRRKKAPKFDEFGGIADMSIDPPESLTSSQSSLSDARVSRIAARVISHVLTSGISIRELGFHALFDVTSQSHHNIRRNRVDYRNQDGTEDDKIDEDHDVGHKFREKKINRLLLDDTTEMAHSLDRLWTIGRGNIWNILGWAFRCASCDGLAQTDEPEIEVWGNRTLQSRWPAWKETIGFLLDAIGKDWKEVVNLIGKDPLADKEPVIRDSLIFKFLRGLEINEYNVKWKDALGAIFASNHADDTAKFRPIYAKEVNKKNANKVGSSLSVLTLSQSSYVLGTTDAVRLRKQALGLVYDCMIAIANLVDKTTFFREMEPYIRDLPADSLFQFLEAPELHVASQTEYEGLLAETILMTLSDAFPNMPNKWLYNFENGKQYISKFLNLGYRHRFGDNVQHEEMLVKFSLVIEKLFRTWAMIRCTGKGTRIADLLKKHGGGQLIGLDFVARANETVNGKDVTADVFIESLETGIEKRRKTFEAITNHKEDQQTIRLRVLLRGSEMRLREMAWTVFT